jgi:hypothetical protein
MIKQIYEQTIARLEAEQQREIEAEKQRVLREQVIPFNAEIDKALQEALAAEHKRVSEKVAAIQRDFEEEKRQLTEAAEAKKKASAETAIATAVALVTAQTAEAIQNLKDFIEKQGE